MGAEIDRLEIQIETWASKTNKELDQLLTKMNKIATSLSGISNAVSKASISTDKVRGFSSSFSTLSTHVGASNARIKGFASTLGTYISKTAQATAKTKSLSQTWGSFYASFFPIIRGFKMLGRSIEKSMDYIETFNYYNVSMDKIGREFSDQYSKYGYDSANAYANSFSKRLNDLTQKMTGYKVNDNGVLDLTKGINLGLDPERMMNYQASISAITNSVGLCGETSINTAKALSMLSADLSSFKNVNLQTVMTNMQSGLIGQSRALYKYGIDITNATLQTYAYKYGLSTAVSEMTQADKMQLRLLAILDQSKIAWGDQANTINSVANQYRILKQQISNVARMIGNILMPVVQAVFPVLNGIMIAIQRLLGFAGRLFGIDFSKIMDGISSGYSGFDAGDMADDTSDVADNYDKANKNAKKLQRTILGFDQINKLNDDSSDSGSGSGSSGSGAGGIDLSNEIAAALAGYESVWNEAFEKSVNEAQQYADRIYKIFRKMWAMIKREDYEKLGQYIARGVNYVFESINSAFNWEELGPGITRFVDAYTRTVNSLVTNIGWANIGKTIGDGLNVITNTLYLYLTGIDWINIGTAIAKGLNGMVNSIDWDILGRTIGAWIMKIPNMIYGFVTTLDWSALGAGIGTSLNGALMEFDGETIAGSINGIVNGILDALKAFIKTVDWSEVAEAVGDVLGNLDWGTLAKVGLVLAAAKIASGFSRLVKDGIAKGLTEAIGHGMEDMIVKIGPQLSSLKGKFTGLFADGAIFGKIPTTAFAGIVAGIALIVAGIVDLWNTSETFRDNVKNMLSIIGAAFLFAKEQIWDNGLKPLWDSIKELFGSLYQIYEESGLKDIFEAVVTAIGYIVTTVLAGLIIAIGEIVKFIADKVRAAIDILNGILDFMKQFVEDHREFFDGIKKIFSGFNDFLAGVFSGDWERAWNGIKDIFKGVWDSFLSIVRPIVNKILEIVEKMINGIISGFNTVKRALNKLNVTIPDWVPEFGGKEFGFDFSMTSKISLPRYELGGFPNTGEMFLARENGITEMVGRMGNRAAVANNDQIVSGIASGVKDAIVDAVAEIAIAMNTGSESSVSSPVVEVIVKCDSETLYKTTQRGKQKADRRYQVVVPVT